MVSEYLKNAFIPEELERIANSVYRVVKETNSELIVARGISGTIVVSAVAAIHKIPFAIVRKPNESSHSYEEVELTDKVLRSVYTNAIDYTTYHTNWLIVDDLISTGATVRIIAKAIVDEQEVNGDIAGKCTGIVLYAEHRARRDVYKLPALGYDVPIFKV